VFQAVIAVVNCIKNSPLRRLFVKLYDDMEGDTQYSLCYCETSCFSHGRVLHRVSELKEEMGIFLSESNNRDVANSFYNEDFVQKVAYFVDIL
jgi:hypothetical protein